jgi:hypothetical protein
MKTCTGTLHIFGFGKGREQNLNFYSFRNLKKEIIQELLRNRENLQC